MKAILNKNLNSITVHKNDSILQAIKKIEKNKNKAVFVIDDCKSLMNVLTDGDIRRFIIKQNYKFDLKIKIECLLDGQKNCVWIREDEFYFKNIAEIFKSNKIEILPIVDRDKKVLNYITRDNFHTLMLENKSLNSKFNFSNLEKNKIEKEIIPRPWGFYRSIILTQYTQAKIISLFPKQSISLQKHNKREEHWIIIYGKGEVILENSCFKIYPGKYIFIPKACKHRILNSHHKQNLILCEVQLGTYFGEDDIIRYEDQYNRR